MKKVCVFTLYPEKGASSKYRFFLYKKDLQAKFELKIFSFWNDAYVEKYMHYKKKYAIRIAFSYLIAFAKRLFQLLFIAPKSDVCFFQKACIPKFRYNHIANLKKKGVRVVFDIDDAVYVGKRDYSDNIAELSDVVICGNEVLSNHYRKKNPNVILMPTVENTNLFRYYWKNTFGNKTIGWIGSMSTIDNLDLVVSPINKIVNKHPEVNFLIISNTALDYEKKIKNCRFVKWNKETYISDLSNISIGIMPLKNSEVNRGKCGFKLIQYLNLKKPVVASDVGVNKDIVGACGLLANDEREWINAIESLLMDEENYSCVEKNIENSFFEKYSYEKNLDKLCTLFGS